MHTSEANNISHVYREKGRGTEKHKQLSLDLNLTSQLQNCSCCIESTWLILHIPCVFLSDTLLIESSFLPKEKGMVPNKPI